MARAIVVGPHVQLRGLESDDVPQLHAWVTDPELKATLLPSESEDGGAGPNFLSEVARSALDVVLGIATPEGQLVGFTGLHAIDVSNRTGSLFVVVGERTCWGRGLGTEAVRLMVHYGFDAMELDRIELDVLVSNSRALRAYEKAGFRRRPQSDAEAARGTVRMAVNRADWRP